MSAVSGCPLPPETLSAVVAQARERGYPRPVVWLNGKGPIQACHIDEAASMLASLGRGYQADTLQCFARYHGEAFSFAVVAALSRGVEVWTYHGTADPDPAPTPTQSTFAFN